MFSLTSFDGLVPVQYGMLLNILSRQSRLVYTCSQVYLAAVYTRTNFPCPKAGMTSFNWNMAPCQGKIVNFFAVRMHEQIKLVKEKLPPELVIFVHFPFFFTEIQLGAIFFFSSI